MPAATAEVAHATLAGCPVPRTAGEGLLTPRCRCREHSRNAPAIYAALRWVVTCVPLRISRSRRRARAHSITTHTSCIELAGVPMEFVERADDRPEQISIARCRELLGEEAESMTDQDVVEIRRHAETMAWIVVEMSQDHCRLQLDALRTRQVPDFHQLEPTDELATEARSIPARGIAGTSPSGRFRV
jgi:hypothetical protein